MDKDKPFRLSRDDYFMQIAETVAKRGTCTRASVGCVLVDVQANKIAATGYSGSLKGSAHCLDRGCLMHNGHCIRTLHAETNAVLQLERRYSDLYCYTTSQPCINCFKLLLGANVKKIYYIIPYADEARDKLEKELFDESIMVKYEKI